MRARWRGRSFASTPAIPDSCPAGPARVRPPGCLPASCATGARAAGSYASTVPIVAPSTRPPMANSGGTCSTRYGCRRTRATTSSTSSPTIARRSGRSWSTAPPPASYRRCAPCTPAASSMSRASTSPTSWPPSICAKRIQSGRSCAWASSTCTPRLLAVRVKPATFEIACVSVSPASNFTAPGFFTSPRT